VRVARRRQTWAFGAHGNGKAHRHRVGSGNRRNHAKPTVCQPLFGLTGSCFGWLAADAGRLDPVLAASREGGSSPMHEALSGLASENV
jgi:hypothetical protein